MPASDIRVKKFPVELDKKRTLCYDMNAFAEIEDKFGTVQKALEELSQQRLKSVITILWAGLLHEDETLTERQVGAMFSLGHLPELTKPIIEAINAALPKVDEKAKNK